MTNTQTQTTERQQCEHTIVDNKIGWFGSRRCERNATQQTTDGEHVCTQHSKVAHGFLCEMTLARRGVEVAS